MYSACLIIVSILKHYFSTIIIMAGGSMEYTLLSPASLYPPAAFTSTTVAARSSSGCCRSHSLCVYWDWGQLPGMLHYVFCDMLLIELSRESEQLTNIFLIRAWHKIFLVDIFITQLLRWWLVHVVLIWLHSHFFSEF